MKRQKRILAIASSGGHWIQLTRLRPVFENCDTLYVTTLPVANPPSGHRKVKTVRDASRSEPFRLILLWFRLLVVVLGFRPDVIITTGAAPGLIALQICRMLGVRTIWIDSIANADDLSMSGKIARRFADLWATQWAHLTQSNPGLRYLGKVI